jgi:phage replication O-like protein O
VQAEQPVASYGNPQVEDGYTKIANELLDAIIRHDFSKRQQKIVLFIIRKTYGFNKKKDELSLSQIMDATGLDRGNTSKTISELVDFKVLLKQQGKYAFSLELNKKYKDWEVLLKQQGCQNNNLPVLKQQSASVKTTTTKDTSKNNTKDICVAVLNYLNEKAGKKFSPTVANLRFIDGRLKEGFTEQDCLSVIDAKVKEWAHTDMGKYLRPETLFNATKFSQYSGEQPSIKKAVLSL